MTEENLAVANDQTAEAAPSTAAAPRQPTRRKRRAAYSNPTFTRSLTLNSLQSQRVYNRSFRRVAQSLFQIDVILQIITDRAGDRNAIDAMETKIREYFDQVSDDLNGEIERCKKLLADNGISELVAYSAPLTIQVEMSSPQIIQFVRLMTQLDEFMSLIDTLWMNTVINNRQRADANYIWQQRLMKLSGRIIGNENRARAAARRIGLSEEVDEFAPEEEIDDEELAQEAASASDEEEDAQNL